MISGWVKVLPFYLFTFLPLKAQDSLLLRDYQFVKISNPWLSSTNASALTRFDTKSITEANASLSLQKGGLVDYYQAPKVVQANVAIESYYRLSPRTVVFGHISYDNYAGKNMTGSAFIDPTRKPFDIAEDSLTNPGNKHRDTYRLAGGVGVDVWRGYAIGARVDYTSANYAKYKDLRHKNKLMDLSASVGIFAPVLPWMSLGADYVYHRNTESITFSTYGKSEKVYKSLINYGAFFGTVEQFGNEGFTDKSREMPLFEDSHGANFQLELRPIDRLALYGTIGFSNGSGYYGRKSPYTITYTNHDRNTFTANATIIYHPSPVTHHLLAFTYRNEKLANRANTYRELTNESGAYYYEYYDAVETADKQWQDIQLDYICSWGIRGELPTWQLHASWQWMKREQLNYLFPYYRHQNLTSNTFALAATRNIVMKRGVWTINLDAAFCKGSGEPYEDNTYVTPSSKQQEPATMDAFLYRNYQYLTAPQYHIGGSVKYAFIFPGTRLKTHAMLSISHQKANKVYEYSQGCDRLQTAITLGCTF